MRQRLGRFTEAIEIIRRLWREDNVSHAGQYWQFSGASIRPRPLQSPHPPIIIGAQVEAAIERAARIGDGWLIVPIPTTAQLRRQVTTYSNARAQAKLPASPHICRLLEVGCAADEDQVMRRVAPFLIEKYKAYFAWGLEGLTLDPDASPQQQFLSLARNRFAVGTPAQVVDTLVEQAQAGVHHLSMRVSWPGMPQDDILAGIELLAREVLPEVRRRTSAG
jgi:alkanesulfonate monooxygenase SsuD/methylene tetrahydromethanopterin reductase-like flavin-dependent oxidoreductase (luciferase family)